MMADINAPALEAAAQSMAGKGGKVQTIVCDVTQPEDVSAGAKAAQDAFGNIHMVFNNAGVGLAGRPGKLDLKDWQWIVDINLMGVVYGVEAFAAHMLSHGEPSHIINTASMAGHFTMAGMGPYHATKFAVVGYSETLAQELAGTNIGVSVLCPTWVKSKIYAGALASPTAKARSAASVAESKPKGAPRDDVPNKMFNMTKALVENGMEANVYADLVLKSILARRLYVFNDPEARSAITVRRDNILRD
jgi:NAD(P)-dependent dehydrogenase (short-subunit alcohol dehydrogenase family)